MVTATAMDGLFRFSHSNIEQIWAGPGRFRSSSSKDKPKESIEPELREPAEGKHEAHGRIRSGIELIEGEDSVVVAKKRLKTSIVELLAEFSPCHDPDIVHGNLLPVKKQCEQVIYPCLVRHTHHQIAARDQQIHMSINHFFHIVEVFDESSGDHDIEIAGILPMELIGKEIDMKDIFGINVVCGKYLPIHLGPTFRILDPEWNKAKVLVQFQ